MMVTIDHHSGTRINPDLVASLEWDRRFYVNGSSSSLVIRMADGTVHRIEHGYGVDAYEIEREILGAQA